MERVKCLKCGFVNPEGQATCLKCRAPLPRVRIQAQAPPPPMPAAPEANQFTRGQVVANRYTVLNLVGRGGMGCIYKVHDNTLGEEVALKTLLPQFAQDKMVVERFFNEARIARRLAHPNIVRVHDIGIDNGVLYISMEFMQGRSLRDILEKMLPGEQLPLRETLRIMDELCAALSYAHRHTIHRDIKPENVMLQEQGTVKLMDFGISKLMDNNRLTGASIVMGTPFYMSPEQLRNSRDVDARADIYSVGVMLYEVLTGNMPTGIPKPASEMLKDVPPAMDNIVARCVDPNPDQRYQSADELRAALAEVRRRLEAGTLNQKTVRQRGGDSLPPMRRVAGLLVALALLGGMGYGLYAAEQRRATLPMETDAGTLSPLPLAGDAPESVDESIEDYAALWRGLLARAETVAGSDVALQDAVSLATAAWLNAESSRDLVQAREAAQSLAGLVMASQTPGMVYVAPGVAHVRGEPVAVAPFLMDLVEVTIGDFARFCRESPEGWRMPSALEGFESTHAAYPMTFVAYYDAAAFAAWRGCALPSEAQWARAAAAPDGLPQPYAWGDTWEVDAANTNAPGVATLEPVGTFEMDRTPAGCMDMTGNVSEWTSSLAPGSALGPEGTPWFGTAMVIRGGSYRIADGGLDTVDQAPFESTGEDDLGFRCVKAIPATAASLRTALRLE